MGRIVIVVIAIIITGIRCNVEWSSPATSSHSYPVSGASWTTTASDRRAICCSVNQMSIIAVCRLGRNRSHGRHSAIVHAMVTGVVMHHVRMRHYLCLDLMLEMRRRHLRYQLRGGRQLLDLRLYDSGLRLRRLLLR